MQKINIDKQTVVFFILAVALAGELLVAFPWGIKKISGLTMRISKITRQITSVENEWPRKDRYVKDREELKEKVKRIQGKFVLRHQESKILSFISVSSKEFNVKIQSLTPGELEKYSSTKFGEFKYLPITIKADGKFHDLVLFLNHLNGSQYFFEVKKLDILSRSPYNSVEMVICAAVAEK